MDDLSREELLKSFKNIEDEEYLEDYEKEHIHEQILELIEYYEKRFNEKVIMSDEFWNRIKTGNYT